ncbi:hypothetical protein GGR51DRAFT_558806 [Nemania sp. FL0031]|nr:hypothetical protein GGR51DRAFT_558806 [Nemania sp. FL0031]
MDFSNVTRHIGAPPACKCRRNPDPKQAKINEETVARHAHKLWSSGKCSVIEMLNIFAKLKLGLPVAEKFELYWDEEKKVWDTSPQKEKKEKKSEEPNDAPSPSKQDWSFESQVSSASEDAQHSLLF